MGYHDGDRRSSGHRPSSGRDTPQSHLRTTCSPSESDSMGTLYPRSGHPGIAATVQLLTNRFCGPHCRPIPSITFGNVPPVSSPNPLTSYLPASYNPLPIPQRPWSHIAIDFITDFPLSGGHTTILTVIDRFSKACRFIPLPKLPTALETAENLCNYVFRFYGLPEDIVSDRGPQFTSRVWSAFCQKAQHKCQSHPPVTTLSPMVKWSA